MKSRESDIISLLYKKEGSLPASHWSPIFPPAHLRIFWNPTNDMDLVLPKECEPSDQGKKEEIDLAR